MQFVPFDSLNYSLVYYIGADCSLKICPYSLAWADQSLGEDDAHNSAECSNMGLCDRATGLCTCRKGFEGNKLFLLSSYPCIHLLT